jgi:4-oxalocrotonate tautomerase
MPIIHIYCKNNKTLDMKRNVTRQITDSFVQEIGVSAELVQVFWHEIDDDNYARGGVLLCDRKQDK